MQRSNGEIVFIVTTLLVVFLVVIMIMLFIVFSKRRDRLIKEKEEAKKRYEKEITETQIEIREETLRNISWELHDNIGQLLTLAKIQLQDTTYPEDVVETSKTLTKSLEEVRSLSKLINPEFIRSVRLKEALRLEIERFNRLKYIKADLQIKGDERELDKKNGIILFRILQEFFSNTIKHSRATQLDVVLNFKKQELEITAKDNGIGFKTEETLFKGIGLQNIKKRAELIKANLKLDSKPKEGTLLKINYYFGRTTPHN